MTVDQQAQLVVAARLVLPVRGIEILAAEVVVLRPCRELRIAEPAHDALAVLRYDDLAAFAEAVLAAWNEA